MFLNTIKRAKGAVKKANRVGRGIGCGNGKTCGRGHKGQRSRSGGYHKIGFEGGQMPLHRRLPKFGFNSYIATVTAEVRLTELQNMKTDKISLSTLKEENVIKKNVKYAKIILSGKIEKAVTISGLRVTSGAKKAVESAGGKVED